MKLWNPRVLATLGLLLSAGAASADSPDTPFLVGLAGDVVVIGAEGHAVGVTLGRKVAPGTVIEVRGEGRARLTYPNGSRFDLLSGTRLVLGSTPPKASDKVVPLEGKASPLQLLPLLNPPTSSFAAIRVRGKKVSGIQIGTDGDSLSVAFEPVAGSAFYRVKIEAKGAVVHESVSSEPRMLVPLSALGEAGELGADELRCVVVTHDPSGDFIEGSATFSWPPSGAR